MSNNSTDNKIPIYQLKSKEKVLDYYVNWTKKGQFNKDMIEWNYQAPQNTVQLFDKHALNKDINILDAGCGTGLVGMELQKYGYTKITGADFKALKRKNLKEGSDTHVTKDGRTVKKGLYYYMNKAKKEGRSKPGKGTVTDKALKQSAKTAKA